jgi:biotin-[acetyl-CoA-carboxylase] ligase BirA-like protein
VATLARRARHTQTHGVCLGAKPRAWSFAKALAKRVGTNPDVQLGLPSGQGSAALAALPLLVGLLVQQTLAEQQVHAQLKWPNDIVVDSRKLCGILVESKQRGERWHVVIGIGVNVMQPQQEALREIATACNAQTADFSCTSFLAQFLPQLDQAMQTFFKQGFEVFQAAYAAQMRDLNQPVNLFERGKLIGQGTAVGVTEVGRLALCKMRLGKSKCI